MPNYEYVCRACNHEFEELIRSSADRDAARCPACESNNIVRKLSIFTARQGESTTCDLAPGGVCSTCCNPDDTCPL